MSDRLSAPVVTPDDVRLVADIRRKINDRMRLGFAFTDKEAAQLVAAHIDRVLKAASTSEHVLVRRAA